MRWIFGEQSLAAPLRMLRSPGADVSGGAASDGMDNLRGNSDGFLETAAVRYALIAATLSYFFPPVTVLASTWLNISGGSWNVPGNWNSLPNAIDAIADFSTLDIAANATITLDNSAGIHRWFDVVRRCHAIKRLDG